MKFSIVLLVLLFENCAANNDSVVMDLKKNENGTYSIQPRSLLSSYNSEREELRQKLNNESSLTFEAGINFPQNLEILTGVLRELENEECVRDTNLVLQAMANREKWALQMFDSFPKFPVGILYGNYYQLGNFDECIGVKHLKADNDSTSLQGKYCLADIHFKFKKTNNGRFARSAGNEGNQEKKRNRSKFNNTLLHWGTCLPSSCTSKDAEIFVKEIFSSVVHNFDMVKVLVEENKCYEENASTISTLEIVYGCVIGFLLILTALATGFHCWYIRQRKRCVAYNVEAVRPKENNTFRDVILCFSVIHNIDKWLHIRPNELNLECFCGIKFISMVFIIVGHSLIFAFGGPTANTNFFDEMSTRFENGFLFNNTLLVDTFLLMSGFLLCRLFILELEKRKGKINFFILYIARYIRLTPSYIIVLGLYVSWLERLGSGPLWKSRIGLEKERCLTSWWANLLYINNYVNVDQLCMFQSWYLAVDFHLFIIAPFLIYALYKWSKIGKLLLGICTVAAVVVPFWVTFKDNLDPTLMAYPPEVTDISTNFYFANVYIKTHIRASSYCIGIIFGYLVHKLQSSGTKIPPYIVYLGCILALAMALASMFSILVFYNPEHIADKLESAIYASLHRVAWSLAIGWIIVLCITENAAVINKFLSWKPFIPASRLTYCAYLANGLVEIYGAGVLRDQEFLSRYELACKILGHVVLTFIAAFVLCIFCESPVHGLEKILLKKDKRKHETES